MRLDNSICLGGRFNNKDITGIKINGYIIYPIEEEVDEYGDYIVVYASEGESNIYVFDGGYGREDCTIEEFTDENGLIITMIKLNDINISPYITFANDETVKKIMKMSGNYLHSGINPNDASSFALCKSLEYVDVSKLNFSNATNLEYMFLHCESLTTIVGLNKINTNNVTTMFAAFSHCLKLESIDLSNFNTSSVTHMRSMFSHCESLKKLDLSSFNTLSVTTMEDLFSYCYELEEINMSNFNIRDTVNTYSIFYRCDKLRILRLDNCNNTTISKILGETTYFPTGLINGETRKIYCKRENAAGLTAPDGWEFIYMDTLVSYDESQEKLLAPDYTIAELIDEQLIINDGFADYDADNENININ